MPLVWHNRAMNFIKRRRYAAPWRQAWELLRYRYFRRYVRIEGDARQICHQTVVGCWNGVFYATSMGNFNYFWIRDFAAVVKSLRALGQVERVQATLRWALTHYITHDAVTLCITPTGRLFDAPTRGVDTLPSLLHCLWSAKYQLDGIEREFLNRKLAEFAEDFIEPDTGMLRPHIDAAELRDGVLYDRSAYAVAMVERMAWAAEHLGLQYGFSHRIYRDELLTHYWNGQYFNADYTNTAFSAECALVPFIMRSVEDADKLNLTLDYIRDHQLALPVALRYTDTPRRFRYRWWATTVMRNYAGDTIWTWHGAYYLRLLWGQGRPEATAREADFAAMLERYHTFPELLHPDGRLYDSLVYKSSEGMIWAAIYLTLEKYRSRS